MPSRLHKRWFRVDETDGILRVALVPHKVADAESDAQDAVGFVHQEPALVHT